MPAHHGRRCENYALTSGVYSRCEYRWTFKECEKCGHDNDIAARYCSKCKAEIIDPNEKLQLEYQKIKSKPSELSTDKVLSWSPRPYQAKSLTLKVDFTTEYRTFLIWFSPKKVGEWKKLCLAFGVSPTVDVHGLFDILKNQDPPKTISSRKEPNGFYKIYGYNEVEDEIPTMA
jgi:DNA repair protein RadD